MPESLEEMLTGGHSNSLGNTVEVVEIVLASPSRFDELFGCYRSSDEVVRLRMSNAMKRIEAERHDLLVPYVDRFISEIGELDQEFGAVDAGAAFPETGKRSHRRSAPECVEDHEAQS